MTISLALATITLLSSCTTAIVQDAKPVQKPLDAAQIKQTMQRAADWQLANPNGTLLNSWVIAPLYDGLIHMSESTGDPKYLAPVVRMGTQMNWGPGIAKYHADDHAVGHAWLDIYLMDPTKKERLTPFQHRIDSVLAKPITDNLSMARKPPTEGVYRTDRWTWCDALYMAPPTLSRLAKATGDSRYLDFMDAEFKTSYNSLYDPQENLFYRDERFIGKTSKNGKKVFWSRGNGWVFAGIALMLEDAPENWPQRKYYTELLQKMAPAIVAAQQPDGLWYPSLLDPQEIPVGETSGSAFFVYGLTWCVNHGVLDRAKYWPVIERGWNGLGTRMTPEGRVGYVQGVGDAPAAVRPDGTQLYATGGVLLAGSEILHALNADKKVERADLLRMAEKMIADDKTPRAYARLVPQRDDLAWENDKVAFRVYGPALRAGTEASGIDIWAKKVPYPIIDKWYADDFAKRKSYHKNYGEGYDGFEVGDSPGCGGLAIWNNGNVVHADVYDRAQMPFIKPDVVQFNTFYTYPAVNGTVYYERRSVRLRMGERLNDITAHFSLDAAGRQPAANLEIAVGLQAQTAKAEFTFQPETGVIAMWDSLTGKDPVGTGAIVTPGAKMIQQPHTSNYPKFEQGFAIVRTDAKGDIHYRAGFGWTGDGEIKSKDDWLAYLNKARANSTSEKK